MLVDLSLVLAAALAAALWAAAVAYSRHTYPFLACRACGGTGRSLEPRALMVLCLRWRRRAFRDCPACAGSPAIPRRRRPR